MSPPAPPAPPVRPVGGTWPTVLGVIGIVFGALGMVGGFLYAVIFACVDWLTATLAEMLKNSPRADVQLAQLEAMARHDTIGIVSSLVWGVLGCLLLAAGIAVMRRRAWGATGLVAWSILKMAHGLFSAWFGYIMTIDQFTAMEQAAAASSAPGPPPGMFGLMARMGGVVVVFQLLWLWALPVFLLVWLSRRTIREQVRNWK
ncbi:MAG: hypothetical protein ACYTG1_01175 [Planctomycetota bacterium]